MGNRILLTINSGSSSCKTALFALTDSFEVDHKIVDASFEQTDDHSFERKVTWYVDQPEMPSQNAAESASIIDALSDWLTALPSSFEIAAIGHRIVHSGGRFSSAVQMSDDTVNQLENLIQFDRIHAKPALDIIKQVRQHYPNTAQAVCFDSYFFNEMPKKARAIALPERIVSLGVQRYGFHGLSYTFVQQEFGYKAGTSARNGRVVYAHLGSGSSLCATKDGNVIDTTMGFSPASGIPSSNRSGDIDPTIAGFIDKAANITADELADLSQTESGLRAISGSSGSMKHLLNVETHDSKAAEAVEFYVYSVQKAIGALVAAIGGIDSLVFTGGIGEQSSILRQRICDSLAYLGIELHDSRNFAHDFTISSDNSQVGVHVIPTDEGSVIADQTASAIRSQKVTA